MDSVKVADNRGGYAGGVGSQIDIIIIYLTNACD